MAARRLTAFWAAAGVGLCSSVAPCTAEELPPPAYVLAAQAEGVPAPVLYALALTESAVPLQHGQRPWPWTLNIAGKPQYFRNRESACAALRLALASTDGKRVDVGLAQINWGWHAAQFQHNPCAALHPYHNLQSAARLLRGHFAASGNWLTAAARYHRPAGGKAAQHYQQRFARQLARVMQVSHDELPAALQRLWVSR